eukprot:12914766-Prorocentrum_lima.AAC.1
MGEVFPSLDSTHNKPPWKSPMEIVKLGPRLVASLCGIMPSGTDTCTLVYSKPLIASSNLA